MSFSRRDLTSFLPALLAASAEAAGPEVLPSRAFPFASLPVKTNPANGANTRQVFHGDTHTGVLVDLHITTLPPGQAPHPPHRHVHEELFFVQQGTIEALVEEQRTILGPGGVAYFASNQLHGIRNTGVSPAQYFVLSIGQD